MPQVPQVPQVPQDLRAALDADRCEDIHPTSEIEVTLPEWRGRILDAARRGAFTDSDLDAALDGDRCMVGERVRAELGWSAYDRQRLNYKAYATFSGLPRLVSYDKFGNAWAALRQLENLGSIWT